jgi:ATP-dependent helicase/nuclease subunit A
MLKITDKQNKAITSTESDVLVSAGAGSGKTFVLVERYIHILRQYPEISVSQIIAVTYTRKAADEMRQRLKAKLSELINSSEGNIKERWKKCLSEIDQAQISTIHSLCESILKTFSVEASIDPHFEILDELEGADLRNSSIDEVLLDEMGKQPNEHLLLLEYPAENLKTWLESTLKAASEYKESRNKLIDAINNDYSNLNQYIKNTIELFIAKELKSITDDITVNQKISFLKNNSCQDPQNLLAPIRESVLQIFEQFLLQAKLIDSDSSKIWETYDLIAQIPTIKIGNIGGSKGNSKDIRACLIYLKKQIEEFIKKCPHSPNETDRQAEQIIQSIICLADRVHSVYNHKKIQKQKLDYNDLIDKTYQLLKEPNSNAKLYFNENIKAILVDEFQDTNSIQAMLLSYLAGAQTRLFLIGDDKQSIYKFQGADIRIFNYWKNRLNSSKENGLTLDLDQSFRSNSSLVAFINAIFYKLFDTSNTNESYKASYQALEAIRQDGTDEARAELILFSATKENEKHNSEISKRLEANLVAAWIKEKVKQGEMVFDSQTNSNRPIKYSDFAVLLQVNSQFKLIELALSSANVPYISISGSGLLHTTEIIDLENILKWCISPDDNHSLLGILRSPMFGISDDLIHELVTKTVDMISLWSIMQTIHPEDDMQYGLIKKAVYLLNHIKNAFANQTTDQLIRTIISITSYDVILSAMPHGHQRSRNIWKFADLASKHNHMSMREFLKNIEIMRQLKVEQTGAPLASDNAVKIMTIHKSKGLEFAAVALPLLDYKIKSLRDKFAFNKEYGIVFNTARSSADEKPQYFQLASLIENKMEDAERKRLLYVAMTRAKNYLGLFIDADARDNNSFRKLLKPILQIDESGWTDDGVHTIKAGKTESTFKVRLFNEERLNDLNSKLDAVAANETPEITEKKIPDLHLLDQTFSLENSFQSQPVQWQDLMRVTAGETEIELQQTVVGKYFHLLMQDLPIMLSPERELPILKITAKKLASEKNNKLLEEGNRLLDIFYKSNLYQLLLKAKTRFHEASYILLDQNKTLSDKRPDLLFEDELGQWHIIDFKTDHVKSDNIEEQAKLHFEQLLKYQHDIELICGIKARAWVYFAQPGVLHEVMTDMEIAAKFV